MGTCYSSNQLTNSSTKRPYDKSFQQTKTKSNQLKTTFSSCHHLVTPSYLATISSNQLIQLNNQTNELKPKNSVYATELYIGESTNQAAKMYENTKGKLMSKLPKFGLNKQVHDSSQRNPTTISHFGAKQTLNADLLRLKSGLNGKQTKSSNSSLTNSETSCASSSTNSTASYSNVNHGNNKSTNQNQRKSTFTKATSSSTLNERQRKDNATTNKVIGKLPNTVKSSSSLNQHSSSNQRLNSAKQTECASIQFSHVLTKLPTSKFTTTLTSLPKPQVAQRVASLSTTNRPTALPNLNSNLIDNQSQTLRPYSLKNATNDSHQHKKPYTRTTSQEIKLGVSLRYPYKESHLKSKTTAINHQSQSQLPNKKLTTYSGLPVPTSLRSSKPELRDSSYTNRQSNDRLSQLNHFNQNNHQNQLNETSRSLTLNKDESLCSEKENQRLSTSFESSFLKRDLPSTKELSERINHVKTFNKLVNHQFNNNQNQNLQSLLNKKQLEKSIKPTSNSIETTTEDSNSINERSCTNSQKSNSPNASLTPDLSNASKISPEHNNRSENQIYLDDEISDQPDLMFLNSKDNSTSNSPLKENVNLVDNLQTNAENNYRTNIRYSISELDSLKLKQELLMSSLKANEQSNHSNQVNNLDNLASSVSSSPEKSTSLSSPIRTTTFRKPRPLSYVESENGSLALDSSSHRSILQDIHGIKTLLFRLQGELQKSETQNPFENILNASQTKNQNSMCNGLDESVQEDRCGFMKEDKNEILEMENQNLRKQLALQQQKLDEKDRTIRLLQQQMTKYLNINESTVTTAKKTSNAATQTDRCTNFQAPNTKKTSDGIVVRSSFDDKTDLN